MSAVSQLAPSARAPRSASAAEESLPRYFS